MRKGFGILIGLALVVGTISGCKKGENDPFLSLKSRKARLAGEWELSSMSFNSTDIYEFGGITTTSNESYTYNSPLGSRSWSSSNSAGGSNSGSGTEYYTTRIEFTKDGTFTRTVDSDSDGDNIIDSHYKQEGSWMFLGKNKEGDLKNKEAISLFSTMETYTGSGSTNIGTYSGFQNGEVLLLDRLAKDEMIIIVDRSETDGADSYTLTGTQTYTKNK